MHIICHPHIFGYGLFCVTQAWETALSPRYLSLMSLPSCLLYNINLHLYCTLFCAPLSGPLVLVYKHAYCSCAADSIHKEAEGSEVAEVH